MSTRWHCQADLVQVLIQMKISFHSILEISIKLGHKRRNLQYYFFKICNVDFYMEAAMCNMNFVSQ